MKYIFGHLGLKNITDDIVFFLQRQKSSSEKLPWSFPKFVGPLQRKKLHAGMPETNYFTREALELK